MKPILQGIQGRLFPRAELAAFQLFEKGDVFVHEVLDLDRIAFFRQGTSPGPFEEGPELIGGP